MKHFLSVLSALLVTSSCKKEDTAVVPKAVEVTEGKVVIVEPKPVADEELVVDPVIEDPVLEEHRTPGQQLDHALQRTGEGLQTAGEKTEEGIEKAAEKTGEFLQRAGEKIQDAAEGAGE